MRTENVLQAVLFSNSSSESRIPLIDPIRKLLVLVLVLVDTIMKEMNAEFAPLYSTVGRPSIPPERLHIKRDAGLISESTSCMSVAETGRGRP